MPRTYSTSRSATGAITRRSCRQWTKLSTTVSSAAHSCAATASGVAADGPVTAGGGLDGPATAVAAAVAAIHDDQLADGPARVFSTARRLGTCGGGGTGGGAVAADAGAGAAASWSNLAPWSDIGETRPISTCARAALFTRMRTGTATGCSSEATSIRGRVRLPPGAGTPRRSPVLSDHPPPRPREAASDHPPTCQLP